MTLFFRRSIVAVTLVLLLGIAGVVLRNHLLDSAGLDLKEGLYQQAATPLEFLSHLGDRSAQMILGDLYAFGWGVKKDDDQAVVWYRRALSDHKGLTDPSAPAMYYAGRRYLEGRGVRRSRAEAMGWFERSASGGFQPAVDELSKMQSQGD